MTQGLAAFLLLPGCPRLEHGPGTSNIFKNTLFLHKISKDNGVSASIQLGAPISRDQMTVCWVEASLYPVSVRRYSSGTQAILQAPGFERWRHVLFLYALDVYCEWAHPGSPKL